MAVSEVATESAGPVPVETVGAGRGQPILLLHDVGFDGVAELRALGGRLGQDRPVLLPDLSRVVPSRRAGDRVPRPDEHAALLLACVEELIAFAAARHGGKVDVVASGMMGRLVTRVVRMAPRHVRSLTVLAPAARPLGLRLLARRALSGPLALAARLTSTHAASDASFAAALATTRLRLSPELLGPTWAPTRTPMHVVEAHRPDALEATAASLRAFWSALPTKPELRLIRGGGEAQAVTRARPRLRATAGGRR